MYEATVSAMEEDKKPPTRISPFNIPSLRNQKHLSEEDKQAYQVKLYDIMNKYKWRLRFGSWLCAPVEYKGQAKCFYKSELTFIIHEKTPTAFSHIIDIGRVLTVVDNSPKGRISVTGRISDFYSGSYYTELVMYVCYVHLPPGVSKVNMVEEKHYIINFDPRKQNDTFKRALWKLPFENEWTVIEQDMLECCKDWIPKDAVYPGCLPTLDELNLSAQELKYYQQTGRLPERCIPKADGSSSEEKTDNTSLPVGPTAQKTASPNVLDKFENFRISSDAVVKKEETRHTLSLEKDKDPVVIEHDAVKQWDKLKDAVLMQDQFSSSSPEKESPSFFSGSKPLSASDSITSSSSSVDQKTMDTITESLNSRLESLPNPEISTFQIPQTPMDVEKDSNQTEQSSIAAQDEKMPLESTAATQHLKEDSKQTELINSAKMVIEPQDHKTISDAKLKKDSTQPACTSVVFTPDSKMEVTFTDEDWRNGVLPWKQKPKLSKGQKKSAMRKKRKLEAAVRFSMICAEEEVEYKTSGTVKMEVDDSVNPRLTDADVPKTGWVQTIYGLRDPNSFEGVLPWHIPKQPNSVSLDELTKDSDNKNNSATGSIPMSSTPPKTIFTDWPHLPNHSDILGPKTAQSQETSTSQLYLNKRREHKMKNADMGEKVPEHPESSSAKIPALKNINLTFLEKPTDTSSGRASGKNMPESNESMTKNSTQNYHQHSSRKSDGKPIEPFIKKSDNIQMKRHHSEKADAHNYSHRSFNSEKLMSSSTSSSRSSSLISTHTSSRKYSNERINTEDVKPDISKINVEPVFKVPKLYPVQNRRTFSQPIFLPKNRDTPPSRSEKLYPPLPPPPKPPILPPPSETAAQSSFEPKQKRAKIVYDLTDNDEHRTPGYTSYSDEKFEFNKKIAERKEIVSKMLKNKKNLEQILDSFVRSVDCSYESHSQMNTRFEKYIFMMFDATMKSMDQDYRVKFNGKTDRYLSADIANWDVRRFIAHVEKAVAVFTDSENFLLHCMQNQTFVEKIEKLFGILITRSKRMAESKNQKYEKMREEKRLERLEISKSKPPISSRLQFFPDKF